MMHSRRFALPLLAFPFIVRGVETLRDPQAQVKTSGQVSAVLAAKLRIPVDPERLVVRTAQIQVVTGSLLGLGRARRLAALTLLVSMLPVSYANHVHAQDDLGNAPLRRADLARDVGLMGGLLREISLATTRQGRARWHYGRSGMPSARAPRASRPPSRTLP